MDDRAVTDDDRQQMRRTVAAWAAHTRELHVTHTAAVQSRDAAMYHARINDVPWKTIAADAHLDVTHAYRFVRRWCSRNDMPFPTDPRRKKNR